MPRVKSFRIYEMPAEEKVVLDTVIHVSAHGVFYCNVPVDMLTAARGVFGEATDKHRNRDDVFQVFDHELGRLEEKLSKMLRAYAVPDVRQEQVIRYCVHTCGTWAESEDGEMFPNATFPDTHWLDRERTDRYAGAANGAFYNSNQISIAVTARALTKTTTRFGDSVKVDYEDCNVTWIAERLNAWKYNRLPERQNAVIHEIPYTDAAAFFFNDLIQRMLMLIRTLQDGLCDPGAVQQLAEQKVNLLEVE